MEQAKPFLPFFRLWFITVFSHTINQTLLEVIRADKLCTVTHTRSFTSYVTSLQVPVVAFNNNII